MKKHILYICSMLLVLVLAACGMADDAADDSEGEAAEESTTEETATEEDTNENEGDQSSDDPLVLYGNDFIEVITPQFEEDTGIAIEGVHHSGGEALAQVEAERGNPQWDVLFMDGIGSFENFAERGFLHADWEPENIDNIKDEFTEYVPDDYSYIPIGIHAAGIIGYNTDMVDEEDAPQTWEELFHYDGPMGHADPAVSAPAYPLVSAFFHDWGIEEAQDIYSESLSGDMNVYPTNGPLQTGLISGEVHVAAIQEHHAYEAMLDGEPVGMIWPEEGVPASIRVVAINEESDNIEDAKAFVEYLLEPDTQNFLTSIDTDASSFFTPFSEGAQAREDREDEENINYMLPSAEWAAEHEEEIKTWFADQNID
jgi:iron(III) transport system substrate-binding protein